MFDPSLRAELMSVAHKLADAARVEALRYFRAPSLDAANKDVSGGFDPVTHADRNAEQAMRVILKELRPQDGIIGEEFGNQTGTSDFTWVLDPIDGTRAFICGTASWGVLISIEHKGTPVFGIIDQPYIQERFQGGFGTSELLGPQGTTALKTRSCAALDKAVLLSTFPEIGTPSEKAQFDKVESQVKLTRYGLDCYGYALLTLGQVDLVIEAGLSRYDISGPIAVVQAAGGIMTDWQGQEIKEGGQVIAASDAKVHAEALELLNS